VLEREKEGSMIILDIMKVIQSSLFEVPDIEKLRDFSKKTELQFGDKTVLIIVDMSVFNRLHKAAELLEYEKLCTKISK
jgi:hypothetical protein